MSERPTPRFTASELRALLGVADYVEDPEAMTLKEIAEMARVSRCTVERRILKGVKDGTWSCVGRVLRFKSNGAAYYPEGYKPVSSGPA